MIPHIRTADDRFAELPGHPWAPRYTDALPGLDGLRLAYLDEGPRDARLTWLCLHGNPSWSYLHRKMIPEFLAAGHRVVAPDLIGFGRSDKPLDAAVHRFGFHRRILLEFVEHLDLQRVALVVQDWGGIFGLTLPMEAPQRYQALLVMNTALATGDAPLTPGFIAWRDMVRSKPDYDVARLFARSEPALTAAECAAYAAPFPTEAHRAALRVFPDLVPERPDDEGAAVSRRAREWWRHEWQGRSLMGIGMRDPVLGPPAMHALRREIAGCPDPVEIATGGHFVQEQGEALARLAVASFSAG
jgi:tRNA(adenine34) deaminase